MRSPKVLNLGPCAPECLCPRVPNRNKEIEFGAKEKKIALLFCQAKENTVG